MTRIDDIFDHLSQVEYYTTIGFKSGYFQVELDSKDRPKTAFSTRDQHYQFTVLSQGVTNAYLDDAIIYSPTFDQHLIHLDNILNRLNDANFRLNINKCQIEKTSIDYLGHHIEHSNIRLNTDNIRALLETQQPTTGKEAFQFVKAAEYYCKLIPGFSTIAQSLYKYAPTTKEQRSQKSQAASITKHNTVAGYLLSSSIDNGTNDENEYTSTKSRSTQTDNYMNKQIVAPVMTRTQAK
ncbi:unnamed protein product [Rotaria sordida]|uniref:Reverse transcriptase domain-containing protein n=1 Tax=Rotaria sordida TaxID=392033 RepID=A0A819D5K8_9BILA|nr:unnamed protein product [Rotaria sordida]